MPSAKPGRLGAVLSLRLYRSSSAARRRRSLVRAQGRAGLVMTGPFLLLFAFFVVTPFVYSFILSLHSGGTGAFVGLLNYRVVLTSGQFWNSVRRMAYFGVIQVSVMVGLSIVLALFLDSQYCMGRKFFALAYFLPYAIPGVIAAIMWGFLLEPQLDSALKLPQVLGLTAGPVTPLDYHLALYAIMLIVTWELTGYNMTIVLTSLTNVQREVIEAAKVDGASDLKIAVRIKLPLIRRTVMFITMLSVIGTLQLFNEPAVLNEIASTGNALSPNQIIYNTAFAFGNDPLASAQSIVLAVVTVVATMAFYRAFKARAGLVRAQP